MGEPTDYLFVYGTLMRMFNNPMGDLMRQNTSFVAIGSASGILYHFGRYPGMVKTQDGSKRVYGEIYALNASSDVVGVLDNYEGCGPTSPKPNLFVRERLTVHLDTEETAEEPALHAWGYIYNLQPSHGVKIADGRFRG